MLKKTYVFLISGTDVFRFVISIYMQFKFFVDGEWRHDDHQPFVSGNYGVVNTIFLPREPDMVPAVFSSDAPGGSNMDLDNDPFPRGVRDFSQQSLWFACLLLFLNLCFVLCFHHRYC